jgi:N-hydroxyarylamine O-acetyltransferase
MAMTEWGNTTVDLDRYGQRIGLALTRASAPAEPTVGWLAELHRAHVLAMPFENIDVVLGRPVELTIDAIERKLVTHGRGGVCHEHNLLFAAVLERLGYPVRRVLTRVRDDGRLLLPRGHSALIVEAEGDRWLCDVGYGSDGPLEPIPLSATTVRQGQWRFELEPVKDGWRLHTDDAAGPVLYSVTDAEYRRPDFEVAAYFLLTHPRSPFATSLVVQRITPDARYALRNLDLTVTYLDGRSETRPLTEAELPGVLRERFGLALTEAELGPIIAYVAVRADQPPIPL